MHPDDWWDEPRPEPHSSAEFVLLDEESAEAYWAPRRPAGFRRNDQEDPP